MSAEPPDLSRVQRWMQSVITHPRGVTAGLDSPAAREALDVPPEGVEQVISRSKALNSIERLDVYANAYFARLLEVMAAEFPALVHALGQDLFQGMAFEYLQSRPSQSYTLGDLAAGFPDELARTRPPREGLAPDWADFLVDLARLERTYSEVFDGPGVEGQPLLSADQLRTIAPERWLQTRLVPVPCLRLLTFHFPVHEYATAVRKGEGPEPPEAAPTHLVVTRRDYVVRRTAAEPVPFAVLSALVDGASVGESLALAIERSGVDAETLAPQVRRWFHEWSAAGYFCSV